MNDNQHDKFPGYRGLWQADAKYRDMIAVLSEGIVIMTADGIQESNASADRILGLHVDGQEGCAAEDPSVFLYNADGSPLARENHPCYITLATGKVFTDVVIGFGRAGERLTWVSINARPVWTVDSPLPDTVVASIRDITREREATLALEAAHAAAQVRANALESERQKLEALLHELENQRELREQFVMTLVHDLRTPLTVAKFGAEKLLSGGEELEAVQLKAQKILGSVIRMDHMVRDMLDSNRILAGHGLILHKRFACLHNVTVQAIAGLREIYPSREILVEGEAIGFDFCSGSIQRVVENLVNNAVKYAEPESPIRVSVERREGRALISVHNMGAAIPLEKHKDLFDPYSRANVNQGDVKGWGLGLSLVKGIAEAHQGEAYVSSSEGDGTVFTVSLPL